MAAVVVHVPHARRRRATADAPLDSDDRLGLGLHQHFHAAVRQVLYETGQESPVTLLRCITDVGLDNQFVNLDTANLILYGKGNPVDALDVVGKLVRGMHAKDGMFPTDPKELGKEVPIGQGRVDFPTLFKRLKKLNYRDAVTIEREISGPQQLEDVRKEKIFLEKLIA